MGETGRELNPLKTHDLGFSALGVLGFSRVRGDGEGGARRSAPRIKNRTHQVLDQTPAVNGVRPVKHNTPRHCQTTLFSTCQQTCWIYPVQIPYALGISWLCALYVG